MDLATAAGWLLAVALLLELRRRSGLIHDAAHELRGPLTAISLGIEALRRQPAARHRAEALATEVCRMEMAADDAAAAAGGRRAVARPAGAGAPRCRARSRSAARAAHGPHRG